jgi:decaprenylphospho-beta-D-erythro-pentofuranosid-2-ulose 2-reductase
MSRIVIIGATSAIAHAAARLWAEQGAALCLVGRNADRLEANAADLRVRGAANVVVHAMDATADAAHVPMLAAAIASLGGIDVALIAHGTLPDQRACEGDLGRLRAEIETNGVSVCLLSQLFANHFVAQGAGTLAVIGSVAGDRGRQSNYVYGAAKGLVARFLEGLRNRLAKLGVPNAHVLLVKPGFVDTPMTAEFEKKGLLWAQPEAVAAGILRAIEAKRDVVYLPWFWRWIMLVIRHIPERVFKRLSL